ncbi:hypothetical protein K438DRAFT_1755221 [Mycena galopus ATCC 62051]|nr:hypothetical protein K438DRAFT_1755221 [Mycena galopus ATCC 62051]
MPSIAKSASLVITLAGGLINALLTVQLAGSWGTLRALDTESELEAWKLDGLRVLWGLLAAYLMAAVLCRLCGEEMKCRRWDELGRAVAVAGTALLGSYPEEKGEPNVGRHAWILGTPRVFSLFREDERPSGWHLESGPDEGRRVGRLPLALSSRREDRWGVIASYLPLLAFCNKPSHVRLYRDCSSADLAFTAFLTVLAALAARAPARAACEQPELAPLLTLLPSLLYSSFGFGSSAPVSPDEACERALEHAAVVAFAGLIALTVIRLHFLLAVGTHYSALLRDVRSLEAGDAEDGQAQVQRIRLLPLPKGVKAADVVYAPVHCPAAANSLLDTSAEVWVRAGAEAETAASMSTSYAPAYVSAPPSPASPVYGRAYVQSQAEPEREEQPQRLDLDAGLLDARVVRTKREWI